MSSRVMVRAAALPVLAAFLSCCTLPSGSDPAGSRAGNVDPPGTELPVPGETGSVSISFKVPEFSSRAAPGFGSRIIDPSFETAVLRLDTVTITGDPDYNHSIEVPRTDGTFPEDEDAAAGSVWRATFTGIPAGIYYGGRIRLELRGDSDRDGTPEVLVSGTNAERVVIVPGATTRGVKLYLSPDASNTALLYSSNPETGTVPEGSIAYFRFLDRDGTGELEPADPLYAVRAKHVSGEGDVKLLLLSGSGSVLETVDAFPASLGEVVSRGVPDATGVLESNQTLAETGEVRYAGLFGNGGLVQYDLELLPHPMTADTVTMLDLTEDTPGAVTTVPAEAGFSGWVRVRVFFESSVKIDVSGTGVGFSVYEDLAGLGEEDAEGIEAARIYSSPEPADSGSHEGVYVPGAYFLRLESGSDVTVSFTASCPEP